MKPWFVRISTWVLIAWALPGQSLLRLKNPGAQSSEAAPTVADTTVEFRSWTPGRRHILAEFSPDVEADQLIALREQGAEFIRYVPDHGFILSVTQDFQPQGSGLVRAEPLRPAHKLSQALLEESSPQGQEHLIVELHPDVDPLAGRLIAGLLGQEVLEHPDLLPNHLLVRAPRSDALRLAEWDEVAYVFPASRELVEGQHVEACPGALTVAGPVGQYVATVGDGWDGPGLGSAHLGFHFAGLTCKLPESRVREEVTRALEEWSRAASVRFSEVSSPNLPRTLDFLFGSGEHGDEYPFDGPGRVLAHTFYPAPPNPESIAGDVHFDDDEEWVAGPDLSVRSVDLFSVALHELGHALGLGHSDFPGSVMYPYYRRASGLTLEDLNAIRTLYAGADETPPEPPPAAPVSLSITSPAVFPVTTRAAALSLSGTAGGGTGAILVAWASDRGGAGRALGQTPWHIVSLPLETGPNNLTITATDSAGVSASRTVTVTRLAAAERPALNILSPTTGNTYESRSASVALAGTASPAPGIVRVEWSNSAGGSGPASGTSSWSTGPISLRPGVNTLAVTAYDSSGASASKALAVSYWPPASDTVAPALKITSPAATSVLVAVPTIRLQGIASDNVAVTEVTWSTSYNKSGRAAGTTYWSTGDIPLLVGTNVVVVRAFDAAGNSSWRSLTVTRR